MLNPFEKGMEDCENGIAVGGTRDRSTVTPHGRTNQGGTLIGCSLTGFPLFLPTKLKVLFDYRLEIRAA